MTYRVLGSEKRFTISRIVDQKIVLEIKQGGRLTKSDVEQVLGYLEASGLKLGLLAIFKYDGVKIVRIVNWKLVNGDASK